MQLVTSDKNLEIYATYKSKREFKKLALQKKMRMAIKILEVGGRVKTDIDKDKRTVHIKCYDSEIYQEILKGFKAVAKMT